MLVSIPPKLSVSSSGRPGSRTTDTLFKITLVMKSCLVSIAQIYDFFHEKNLNSQITIFR